jgi:hypothetical protein
LKAANKRRTPRHKLSEKCWIMGSQSQGNEKANQAAKETLDKDISTTERYPPDDLKKWLTEEDLKKETKDGKKETTR